MLEAPQFGVMDSHALAGPFKLGTLWAGCNGDALEEWCLFNAFEEQCKTFFHPWKYKQGPEVELEGGGLPGFATFKDLKIPMDEGAEAKVPLSVQDAWLIPRWADCSTYIADVYGVGMEDEDEVSSGEDLDVAPDVSSSPFDLVTDPNPQAASSTSSKLMSQLVLQYDVNEAVLRAMESGRLLP